MLKIVFSTALYVPLQGVTTTSALVFEHNIIRDFWNQQYHAKITADAFQTNPLLLRCQYLEESPENYHSVYGIYKIKKKKKQKQNFKEAESLTLTLKAYLLTTSQPTRLSHMTGHHMKPCSRDHFAQGVAVAGQSPEM